MHLSGPYFYILSFLIGFPAGPLTSHTLPSYDFFPPDFLL
jgi:hypothetical protein